MAPVFLAPDGPVAQRLEPTAHNGLVGGSNPPGPTNIYLEIFDVSCELRISADHRNDHRNVCVVLASDRVGGALEVFWAVMAVHAIKYFGRHAEISRRLPDRHPALHEPRRGGVA